MGLVTHLLHTAADLPGVTPEQAWTVLTDFQAYSEWGSFFTFPAEVPGAVGERFKVTVQQEGGADLHFVPVVLVRQPPHTLSWRGCALGIPLLLFDGIHTFRLEALAGGRGTRLVHEEYMRGLAVLLMRWSGALAVFTRKYAEWNEKFEARVRACSQRG